MILGWNISNDVLADDCNINYISGKVRLMKIIMVVILMMISYRNLPLIQMMVRMTLVY